MKSYRVILFGGTFDPVHRGHSEVAKAAIKHIGAEKLYFIPARQSPHKSQPPIADNQERLAMLRLVLEELPDMGVSECELKRPGPSYTIDTVRHFRKDLPPQTELYWLLGGDAVRDLHQWYHIHELMELCTLAVMIRAGFPPPDFDVCLPFFSESEIRKLRENVVAVPQINISSTDIRRRIGKGLDVSDMLHPGVHKYIIEKGLYK